MEQPDKALSVIREIEPTIPPLKPFQTRFDSMMMQASKKELQRLQAWAWNNARQTPIKGSSHPSAEAIAAAKKLIR